MAAGPKNINGNLDSPGQGYWPNPNREDFRRPIRTNKEDHLTYNKGNNPQSVSNLRAKGYNIYFPDSKEETILFSYNNKLNFAHKNKYEYIAILDNTDYIDFDYNYEFISNIIFD